ncbi:hypothetical protein INR49_002002 [Caranx melampygus]|nr:hypothetical protein INR49_002002 [Caranx melampygus]
MALKPEFLLLLWGLTVFTHVTSSCNVTCSTDYNVLLNCSCSCSAPTHPVILQVTCSGEEDEVEGSCQVRPPQSWCVMHPVDLYDVASIGTRCRATVRQEDGRVIWSESSSWALSDVVKAQPPFNVTVSSTDGVYNITWDSHKEQDFLTYKVRIRESKDLSKDLVFSITSEKNYIELEKDKLQPHVNYTVDVQAKLFGSVYFGPWSEWSSTAEFSQKLKLMPYIPNPQGFFKPLYNNHGGNFKVKKTKTKLRSIWLSV